MAAETVPWEYEYSSNTKVNRLNNAVLCDAYALFFHFHINLVIHVQSYFQA